MPGGCTLSAPFPLVSGESAMTARRDAPDHAPVRETPLIGGVEERAIVVVPYRQDWPETFRLHRKRIAAALGAGAFGIEHIGSTAVPGLTAKPIVDMLVVVADSADDGALRLCASGARSLPYQCSQARTTR